MLERNSSSSDGGMGAGGFTSAFACVRTVATACPMSPKAAFGYDGAITCCGGAGLGEGPAAGGRGGGPSGVVGACFAEGDGAVAGTPP